MTSKTVLFFPLNSPGHVNSSLGIADKIKADYGYRTVFLILGNQMGTEIVDRGHELVTLEEENVYEDYEIDPDDPETMALSPEECERRGLKKKKFPGSLKWPQLIMRAQSLLRKEPLQALLESMELFEKTMIAELKDNHDNYEKSLQAINPDIIVVDSYFVPPCVVAIKNVPWVRLYSANPLQLVKSKVPGGSKPPPMCGYRIMCKEDRLKLKQEHPERWQEILDTWADANNRVFSSMANALNPIQDLLDSYGLDPPPAGQQTHDSPQLNLYLYPKELDYDQEDDIFEYPPRWFRCDSLMRFPVDNEANQAWAEKLSQAMQGKRETVFFSFGSIASGNVDLMRRYIKMLAKDKDRLYVISKGVNGDSYELDSSNMIGANYIPQTFFLQRADLAIVHGGNNSVTECLYYGVPMIILPNFADQLDNAQRIEDLNLGGKLNVFNCTERELLDTIDEVLGNRDLIQRVRDIGLRMRSRDESGKITFILNKLIEDGNLTQDFIDECRHKDFKDIRH